ncbi:hypothetical protein RHMOL_Rhmol01G0228700 [Rhododendron molle]|uniref:Uncharacterized protein n=1 Tax=Rhododendron molle TaxID=49168 RepID=A0ACC0Q4Z5_RHOML|nr:hypothetical protein RHMOL_Rhmol01G0228700 [Rhododendron molle]
MSDSEIDDYKQKPYEDLKKRKYMVKNQDRTLRCPFCPRKKKQQYKYRDILQHASGVGTGVAGRKAKAKAQHQALAMYLAFELVSEADG